MSLFFILSSPSGAGKSTLGKRLLSHNPKIKLSVSATTRPKRPNEVEGVDYFFITPEMFQAWQATEIFLESEHIYGNHYGTPLHEIQKHTNNGFCILFDVDWHGARNITTRLSRHGQVIRIYVLPPSLQILRERLEARGDTPDAIALRLSKATQEIQHCNANEYDYVIVNDDLDSAAQLLQEIAAFEQSAKDIPQEKLKSVNQQRAKRQQELWLEALGLREKLLRE